MLVSYLIFSILLFAVMLLLIVGFETVGFKLSETLTIFIISSAIYFTSSLSILLYFRGWLGFGLVDATHKIFCFQNILLVGSRGNLAVGFDIAGFLIPFIISLRMIVDKRSPILSSIIGIVVVAVVAYLFSDFLQDEGILVRNIYALSLVASILGIALANKNWEKAGPIAYVSGSLGVLIGADVIRLIDLIRYKSSALVIASVGGAGVFDAIFLVGIFAVIIDIALVQYLRLVNKIKSHVP
jgi:uncharacterized membrane protein